MICGCLMFAFLCFYFVGDCDSVYLLLVWWFLLVALLCMVKLVLFLLEGLCCCVVYGFSCLLLFLVCLWFMLFVVRLRLLVGWLDCRLLIVLYLVVLAVVVLF